MKTRFISLIIALFALFVFTSNAEAHPGRTAADGCHYCRTRCDYWGVPWNERHCHGGVVIPKNKPTYIPPPTSTPTPTFESIPTQEPEVKGETVKASPTPIVASQSESNTGNTILGWAILGGLGLGIFWLVRKVYKVLRDKTEENENS